MKGAANPQISAPLNFEWVKQPTGGIFLLGSPRTAARSKRDGPVITKRPVRHAQGRPEQMECVEGRVPQQAGYQKILSGKSCAVRTVLTFPRKNILGVSTAPIFPGKGSAYQ